MSAEPSLLACVLERARSLSVANQSELVVCTYFLPWLDLALSADAEPGRGVVSGRCEVEQRWQEVAGLITDLNETGVSTARNWTALVSFGLLRCWHVQARERSTRAHGPICLTVNGLPWFKPPWFA